MVDSQYNETSDFLQETRLLHAGILEKSGAWFMLLALVHNDIFVFIMSYP